VEVVQGLKMQKGLSCCWNGTNEFSIADTF